MESIKHIFYNKDFGKGFQTINGILENSLYKPKILILGTFNPSLDSNRADFYYGRNFFWPAFKNIFIHNEIRLYGERLENCPYNPYIEEILEMCKKLEITFSDLICEISDENNDLHISIKRGKEYVNNRVTEYNPINDSDLERLDRIHKIQWNTPNIIDYLNKNPQINTIYFTRVQNGRWNDQINIIRLKCPNVDIISIYTPSAQGGYLFKQTGIYNAGRMRPLIYHWINNEGTNNGRLDRNWLISYGVNPDNF